MPVKIFSCVTHGLEGKLIEVEADILQGLSAFSIVGLGDTAVQEAKERIRSAIKNSGFSYPPQKKVINLAPAHFKKHGPHFDLPMAVSLLYASNQLKSKMLHDTIIVGELALDGSVRPVNGVLTMTLFAKKQGWNKIIIPAENFEEASLVKKIQIIPAQHLAQLVEQLRGGGESGKDGGSGSVGGGGSRSVGGGGSGSVGGSGSESVGGGSSGSLGGGIFSNALYPRNALRGFVPRGFASRGAKPGGAKPRGAKPGLEDTPGSENVPLDFADIKGHDFIKKVLQVAAAGGHHLLLTGPPGVGKTMLARALPSILPPLREEEMLEVMQIYSCAGLFSDGQRHGTVRPFRQVHSSCSLFALTGGGALLKPGEISLAHHGVLFLDEVAEFQRAHLEALRQPLEQREIYLSRFSGTIKYPANFSLVAGMNPCPCGYHGDPQKECRCKPYQVIQYQKKLSGPLLDRLDLIIEIPRQPAKTYHEEDTASSQDLIKQVIVARDIQMERFKADRIKTNAGMEPRHLKIHCLLDQPSAELLQEVSEKLQLSGRAYHQILKTARTFADLNENNAIQFDDITMALQYRRNAKKYF